MATALTNTNTDDAVIRESTFTRWKLKHPNAEEMAGAGFSYTGERDRVECHACGITLENWKENHDPMLRHHQAVEFCPFLESPGGDFDEGISVAGSQSTVSLNESSRGSVASGDSGIGRDIPTRMDPHLSRIAESSGTAITVRDDPTPRRGVRTSRAQERFKQFDERIKSFQNTNWDRTLAATPDKLSKAGFYYVGPGDRVKCAYCLGKLKKWRPKDVAVEEHVKHFPDCSFVKNIEEQTAVLAKNIRSKKKTDNCMSADELKKEYETRREGTKRPKADEIVTKTLKKMKYFNAQIRRAQRRLREKALPLRLENFLIELQMLEKEEYFTSAGAAAADSADESLYSDNDDEEQQDMPAITSTDELVNKLQEELKAVTMQRDEFTHQITCKVCLENKVDTLFLTCRHFVTCKDCADRVRDCPLCRQVILGTVDVFMG